MKHLSNKQNQGLSLLSLFILITFMLFAAGSFVLDQLGLNIKVIKEQTNNGEYKVTERHDFFAGFKTTTGRQDGHGRWHGPVIIETLGDQDYGEEVRMEHGVRQGLSILTYPGGRKVEEHYFNGRKYDLKKVAHGNADLSAFQLLSERYPWFLFSLNAWGYEDNRVEACMDTIETILNTNEFNMSEFETYYDDMLDLLGGSPYDSLISLNSDISIIKGLDDLKSSELRMAVIDGYRANLSTWDNIVTTYPGYLGALNDSGITNEDFEQFCLVLEDSMARGGPLNPEDPFFTDSVDTRLFKALSGMLGNLMSAGAMSGPLLKSASSGKWNDIRGMYDNISSLRKASAMKSGTSEVALVVVAFMLPQLIDGDMIRKAVREAFILKKGIIGFPATATGFIENTSATSATIQGYIFEDGGAAITARGIAWATFYNPEISDNAAIPKTETGSFTVELMDLIPGLTYYARTYATNSAGTGYGNCISFVASSPSNTIDVKVDYRIFPNPVTNELTVEMNDNREELSLEIMNSTGQLIYRAKMVDKTTISTTAFAPGTYILKLTRGNKETAVKKFVKK
jgi:hypothetical protein